MKRTIPLAATLLLSTWLAACGGDDDEAPPPLPPDDTSVVGTFSGLFDDVVDGFNFPFDIGVVSAPVAVDGIGQGDILVANYGTSEVLLAPAQDGVLSGSAEPFYDGAEAGLAGAMAVSIPPDGMVWAAFEQGGEGDAGGVVVLDPSGSRVALLDGAVDADAFASPGGICYGGTDAAGAPRFFMVNKGDGTLWRIDAASTEGDDPVFTRVGSGLATGSLGNPGSAGNPITSSNDTPEGGARGCVHHAGNVYVADAQNARVVRFDDAVNASDADGVPLENTPSDLVTYPTDVTVNNEGSLIVISFDNAQAFVSLGTPDGDFIDDGLQELNVNAGNYGTQVTDGTIWFTRANNSNGQLRAVTPNPQTPPSTAGSFPAQ